MYIYVDFILIYIAISLYRLIYGSYITMVLSIVIDCAYLLYAVAILC